MDVALNSGLELDLSRNPHIEASETKSHQVAEIHLPILRLQYFQFNGERTGLQVIGYFDTVLLPKRGKQSNDD